MSRAGNDFNFLVAQQLQEMGLPDDQARVIAPLVGQYVSTGMPIGDALQLIASDLEAQRGAPAPQHGGGRGAPAPQHQVGGGAAPVRATEVQPEAGNYLALVRSQGFKGEVTAFASLGHNKSLPFQHFISKLPSEYFRQSGVDRRIESVDYRGFLAKGAIDISIPDANDPTIESWFLDGFETFGYAAPWEGTIKDVFLKSAALYQQALLEIDTTDFDGEDLADVASAREGFAGFVATVAAAGDLTEYTRVGFEQLVAQGGAENIYKQVKDITPSLLSNAYRVGNEGLFDEVLVIIKGHVEAMPDNFISPGDKFKLLNKGPVIEYFKALIKERKIFASEVETDKFSAITADIGLIARIGEKFGQDGVEVAKEVMKKSIDKQVIAGNITDVQAQDLFDKISPQLPPVAVARAPESTTTDGPAQLQSVRDVFCSKYNIVTGPGIERMIAALCDLPCANNTRVSGKTIFDKDSRVYSADGQSAFAVAQTSSLVDFVMFAESAAFSGVSSEQEDHLKSIMSEGLDVGVKSNTIAVPFATEHAHWKVVVLRGIKGEDGKFNYQACEIDTDGISRKIDDNLLRILQRVADPEASVENQAITEEAVFDYHLQYNQNCSSAIAMITSALKDQAIEEKTLNLDKFLTAENKSFLDRGRAAQSIVMQRSMTYGQMMSEGVFNIIDSCDKMLREAVFEKMKSLPLSADCWADTCIEGLGVEGRESLDFSGVNLAGVFITDREAPTDFPSYALPGFPGQGQVAAIQHVGVAPNKQFFEQFKLPGHYPFPGEAVSLSGDGTRVSYSSEKGVARLSFLEVSGYDSSGTEKNFLICLTPMTFSEYDSQYASQLTTNRRGYEYEVDISKIAQQYEGMDMSKSYKCSLVNIDGAGIIAHDNSRLRLHPEINPAMAHYAICELRQVCHGIDDKSIAVMRFADNSVAKVAQFNEYGELQCDPLLPVKKGLAEKVPFMKITSLKDMTGFIEACVTLDSANYDDLSVNYCQLPPGKCHVEVCGVEQGVLQDAVAKHVARGEADVAGNRDKRAEVRVGGGARRDSGDRVGGVVQGASPRRSTVPVTAAPFSGSRTSHRG